MFTAKSAGSPAFLPPELCVAQHGDVDGRAADIWSMGITLYCLSFGRIPFERDGPLQLYEAVRSEAPAIPQSTNPALANLLGRLLDKNPVTRISMSQTSCAYLSNPILVLVYGDAIAHMLNSAQRSIRG